MPSCPRKELGPAPHGPDFETIYGRIIAIPTTDRFQEKINKIKIIYDVEFYRTILSKLEDYQKKRHTFHGFKALDDIGKRNTSLKNI